MKLKKMILLLISHLLIGLFGVALGIYILPILIAPASPTVAELSTLSSQAQYVGTFKKDLKDSDYFHWGEGKILVGQEHITLVGSLAPGPDYRLYLSPEFVETETDFKRLKANMIFVGPVTTFNHFTVKMPQGIQVSKYNTVIVWCETFSEFITSAKYQ
ncbi:DM13 domain-containing protein [Shewanella sp. 10N.261.52.F9]|uniref:DM13 domain-containing protein n=1 Tax=Shewanella TaxID=22 RepID=UPI00200D56E4|nr:DM13 domain-containing protein [Shewanella marinintestina]MCL1144721.1 DM13 domain-containing protein [Shewanella marinintestina]